MKRETRDKLAAALWVVLEDDAEHRETSSDTLEDLYACKEQIERLKTKLGELTSTNYNLQVGLDEALRQLNATGWRVPKAGDRVRVVKQAPSGYNNASVEVGDIIEISEPSTWWPMPLVTVKTPKIAHYYMPLDCLEPVPPEAPPVHAGKIENLGNPFPINRCAARVLGE